MANPNPDPGPIESGFGSTTLGPTVLITLIGSANVK
jgi:hypothetical protein